MSHGTERKEKNCLNCGTIVHGRFCHACGQENVVAHQNFWSLARHFIFDIFHFDGKFFDTLKLLFTGPGRVAREYVQGKRVKYLDPIRMYLFTSALFFLVFFTFKEPEYFDDNNPADHYLSSAERVNMAAALKGNKNEITDSALAQRIRLLMDTSRPLRMSAVSTKTGGSFIDINGRSYQSVKEYDSTQKGLPAKKRDNWFVKALIKKGIETNKRYNGDVKRTLADLGNSFFHRMPYMLFLSLPFFAFILKLIYYRRKQFYYSDHAVFTLYQYIFSFIIILIFFCVDGLQHWLHWRVFSFIKGGLFIWWMIYLYKAMRNFYLQSRGKTLLKFIILNLLGYLLLLILFIIFIFFSIFQL